MVRRFAYTAVNRLWWKPHWEISTSTYKIQLLVTWLFGFQVHCTLCHAKVVLVQLMLLDGQSVRWLIRILVVP